MLASRVRNSEAWAAVYVNPGTTAAIQAVLAAGCSPQSLQAYSPQNAFGIVIDEGRSQNPESKLAGLLETTLAALSSTIGATLLQGGVATPAQVAACLQNSAAATDGPAAPGLGGSFLSLPTDYTVTNVGATYLAPVMNSAFGVGNILVAVFASLYVCIAIMKGLGPLPMLPLGGRLLVRMLAGFFCAFGLAVVFATTCVGLMKTGSGNVLYNSEKWAQFLAIQWVHACLWIFGNLALATAISPDVLGLPFGFLLICNIIGGFCMDFADDGYQVRIPLLQISKSAARHDRRRPLAHSRHPYTPTPTHARAKTRKRKPT